MTQDSARDAVVARVRADHGQMVGKRIRATSVVCSDGESFTDDFNFPEPLTLRVSDDTYDLDRWMDDDHCDPWYYVELVEAPPDCQAILDESNAHVLAVYGPSYRLDGTYDKPEWKVLL